MIYQGQSYQPIKPCFDQLQLCKHNKRAVDLKLNFSHAIDYNNFHAVHGEDDSQTKQFFDDLRHFSFHLNKWRNHPCHFEEPSFGKISLQDLF